MQNVSFLNVRIQQFYDGPADYNNVLDFTTRRLYFQGLISVQDANYFSMLYTYIGDSILGYAALSVQSVAVLLENSTVQNCTVLAQNEEDFYLPTSVVEVYSKQLSLYFTDIRNLRCSVCNYGTFFA